jgi:predicted MFS family arabinose efflux permease
LSRDNPSPGIIVFTLSLLIFASSSQIMIISPILPRIGEELEIAESFLGTLVSAYTLMVGIFAIIAGPISDKIGRRRILLLGTGIMTVSLLLHHFVIGYYSFLVVRICAGMAGGILSGAAVAYIGDFFPYNRRGWATGWVMSGMAAGQIAGIPIGIMLAGSYGFRAPFYFFSVVMGMTCVLIWLQIPQPNVKRTEGRLTISRARNHYKSLLKRKEIAAAGLAYFLMFMGISLFVVYLPYWLEQTIGATPKDIAIMFVVGGLASILIGPQAGKLSDKIGRKRIVILGNLGLALAMALTTFVINNVLIAYGAFFVIMALSALRMSPFSALLTALVRDEWRGSLMSLTVALGHVGFAMGAAFAGLTYTRLGYASATIFGAIAIVAMAIVVGFFIPEPKLPNNQSPATNT